MSKTTRHIGSVALALAGLVASSGAFAQSWDLDACARAAGATCAGTGSTLTITGWYSNGAGFTQGTLNTGSDWAGVRSTSGAGVQEETTGTNWNHAIDNIQTGTGGASFAEGALLKFTQAVDISNITAMYTISNTAGVGQFQLWRWDGGSEAAYSTVTGSMSNTMTGWTSVTTSTGDFGQTKSQTVSDGSTFSSYWLVTTKFGGGGNDAFKLGQLTTVGACGSGTNGNTSGGCSSNSTSVPEPMSLALFGIAALGAGAARRRAKAQRA